MFQQDYLLRLIWQFVEAIKRSIDKGQLDPQQAADSIEGAIGTVLDMDAGVVLGLAPESFAAVLQVSGTDPHVVEYLVRSLALEAHYLGEAGRASEGQLRFSQACALAAAYGIIPPEQGEIPIAEDFVSMVERDRADAAGIE